jgi:trk system potassium uptake protein
MRNLATTLHYLGIVLIAFAFLQALPLLVSAIYSETVTFPVRIYAIPAVASAALGVGLTLLFKARPLTGGAAMATGALGWFVLSLIGAVPYWLALKITYLDAFFEAVSGFTTTGSTLLVGLDGLPHSILIWRALTEWIGGLGIFTLFLLVALRSGLSHNLLSAEAHKTASKRFSPGLFHSLRILWGIYGGLTVACGLLLWIEGMSPFDAVAHALATVSTGGFSTHDASIAFFRSLGSHRYDAIQYTIVAFMFLGGTSFLVHWNLLRRRLSAVRNNLELRVWIGLLLVATALVALQSSGGAAERFRLALFQVVSLGTSTGFTTTAIGGVAFGPVAKQVFILLMIVGGCVGSTAGGVKVLRVGVLGKLLWHQLKLVARPNREVVPFVVDGEVIGAEEIERTAAIFFAWIALLFLGGVVTGLLTGFTPLEAFSGMAAALSNVGPSYIPVKSFLAIGPGLKVFYILAMVAGRLEILPLLLIFVRRVWR